MKKWMGRTGIFALILFLGISCKPTKTASFYTYATECLGVESDGSQTVRAWGSGKNKSDALEQAKKNAGRDILFKGNLTGKKECALKPLLLEVNAAEKYESYFNVFFADGGEYENFVNTQDEKFKSKISETNKSEVKYGVIVRVLRSELKGKLINDGILKQ
jgi:hypothetical protein